MENWLKSTLDIDIDLNRNSILFGKINNFRKSHNSNNSILYLSREVHHFKEAKFWEAKKECNQ